MLLLGDLLPFKDSPWHLQRAVGVVCYISASYLLMLILSYSIEDAQKLGGRRGPSILV